MNNTSSLDAITLSVIQAALQQVCDEMDLTFSRAAFSPVIAEANDRSDGIYAAEDGALIAQGSAGLPVFVGVMQYSTHTLIERIASGETAAPEPGDIYIVNDPYLAAHISWMCASPCQSGVMGKSSAGSPTPATGRTLVVRFRAAFPPPPRRWSRKGCACRR